jgi:hypothetical protein
MTSPKRAPAAALLLAGVLVVPAAAAGQDAPYEPTGEVRLAGGGVGSGASFDMDRIVGPDVNLTRRDDGSWGGDLGGQDLDLQPIKDGLQAPNVTLKFSSRDGKTRIEGLYFGVRVRFDIDRKKLEGRFGGCSMALQRKGPPVYRGEMGCLLAGERLPRTSQVSLELIGEAGAVPPPLPQFMFALLAVLPG